MLRALMLLGLSFAAAQRYQGGQGGYEEELLRRQYELQRQQAARQQQGQAQQQASRQAQQQAMFQQQMAQAQREAAMAGGGGGGGGGGGYGGQQPGFSNKPMTKADKKRAAAAQDEREKQSKKAMAARQKAFKNAQRSASKRGAMGASRRNEREGVMSKVLSVKGAAVLSGVGYLWVAQRELLLKLLGVGLKWPIAFALWVGRTGWGLLLKPVLRKLLAMKGGAPAGDLPGGSY